MEVSGSFCRSFDFLGLEEKLKKKKKWKVREISRVCLFAPVLCLVNGNNFLGKITRSWENRSRIHSKLLKRMYSMPTHCEPLRLGLKKIHYRSSQNFTICI